MGNGATKPIGPSNFETVADKCKVIAKEGGFSDAQTQALADIVLFVLKSCDTATKAGAAKATTTKTEAEQTGTTKAKATKATATKTEAEKTGTTEAKVTKATTAKAKATEPKATEAKAQTFAEPNKAEATPKVAGPGPPSKRFTKEKSASQKTEMAATKIQAFWNMSRSRLRGNSLLGDQEDEQEDLQEGDVEQEQMTAEAIDAADAEDAEDAEYRDEDDKVVDTTDSDDIDNVISIKELLNISNHGDLERLETMFDEMASRDSTMDWLNRPLDATTKQRALHVAVKQGRLEILKRFLVEPNIDVNVQQAIGRTPLMWATTAGNIEVLEELLAHKDIRVNMMDNNSKTALHFGAFHNQGNLIKRLCQVKADVSLKDSKKQTPLYVAARNGNAAAIRNLIECKAKVTDHPPGQITALGAAVSNGDTAAVKALIRAKANVVGVLTRKGNDRVKTISQGMRRFLKPYATLHQIEEAIMFNHLQKAKTMMLNPTLPNILKQLGHPGNKMFLLALHHKKFSLAEWIARNRYFQIDDDVEEDGEEECAIEHVFTHFLRNEEAISTEKIAASRRDASASTDSKEHVRVGLSVTAVNRGFRSNGRVAAVLLNDTVDVVFDGENPTYKQNFKSTAVRVAFRLDTEYGGVLEPVPDQPGYHDADPMQPYERMESQHPHRLRYSRLCWTIARRLDSKCTFETFRKCTRQLQFPSNLKTGINLKTYRVLREDPVRVSMFLALVTDFLQSHGMSYELANYLEAVLMMAMINFQNTHIADIKTALSSVKAPTSYDTFVPLGKREFTRSSTSLLFNPLLYIGRTAFPFVKKLLLPHAREMLELQIHPAIDYKDILVEVCKRNCDGHRAMYTATVDSIKNDSGFNRVVNAVTTINTHVKNQTADKLVIQSESDLFMVYVHAGRLWLESKFTFFIKKLGDITGATTISIPSMNKNMLRALEKTGLREDAAENQWNADRIGDVRRSMLGYLDMNNMLMLIWLLAASCEDTHIRAEAEKTGWNAMKAGLVKDEKDQIVIHRIKNRFQNPNQSGWADIMINFHFVEDKHRHVCELQIVHDNMMLVRKKMGGHNEYEMYRSANELLEFHGARME